jgi:hypothetical protein
MKMYDIQNVKEIIFAHDAVRVRKNNNFLEKIRMADKFNLNNSYDCALEVTIAEKYLKQTHDKITTDLLLGLIEKINKR